MQLTLFDILVLAVVGLSALAALMRGAVREVLALVSWAGAGLAAFLFWPVVARLVRPVVASDGLANGVAAAGIFVVALIALKLLSGMVAGSIDGTALGTIDKLLGLAFGAARGVVVVCAAYLIGSLLIKPELQPAWIARRLPDRADPGGRASHRSPAARGLSARLGPWRPGQPEAARAIPTRSDRLSTSS